MTEKTKLSDYVLIKLVARGQQETDENSGYKCQWVVLTLHTVPHRSSIVYWVSKELSLTQDQSTQIPLETFRINISIDGKKPVIELALENCSLFMMFDNTEKFQQWEKAIQKLSRRAYTEIIRWPNHADKEGQYVIEVSLSFVAFYDPRKLNEEKPEFVWKIENIQRARYDINVGKAEVEIYKPDKGDVDKCTLIGPKMKEFYFYLKQKYNQICATKEDAPKHPPNSPCPPTRSLPPSGATVPQTGGQPKSTTRSTSVPAPPVMQTNKTSELEPPPLPPRPLVLARSPVSRRFSQPQPSTTTTTTTLSPSAGAGPSAEVGERGNNPPPLPPRLPVEKRRISAPNSVQLNPPPPIPQPLASLSKPKNDKSADSLMLPVPVSLDEVDTIYDFGDDPQVMERNTSSTTGTAPTVTRENRPPPLPPPRLPSPRVTKKKSQDVPPLPMQRPARLAVSEVTESSPSDDIELVYDEAVEKPIHVVISRYQSIPPLPDAKEGGREGGGGDANLPNRTDNNNETEPNDDDHYYI